MIILLSPIEKSYQKCEEVFGEVDIWQQNFDYLTYNRETNKLNFVEFIDSKPTMKTLGITTNDILVVEGLINTDLLFTGINYFMCRNNKIKKVISKLEDI